MKIDTFTEIQKTFSYIVVIEFAKICTIDNALGINSHQTADFFILLQVLQQLYLCHCLQHTLLKTFSHSRKIDNEKTNLIIGYYCILQGRNSK